MTTEQLRLEIQVQVKEALTNLKATSAEYKQLAQEARRAAPAQAELNAAIASLDHDLKTSAQAAKIFGDELGGLKDQQARLKQGITDLVDRGLAPESAEVQQLKARYDETTAAIKRHGGGVDDIKGRIESLLSSAAMVAATKGVADFVGNAVGEFAKAEASTQRLDLALQLRGMQNARGSLSSLADQLEGLTGIDGDLVTQLEAELIAQGKSRDEVEKTIKAAAGLSAVTGGDLAGSVQQLTSTYSGNSKQLGMMIPAIKDLTEEQLKQGAAIDIVSGRYLEFIGQVGATEISMNRMHQAVRNVVETFGSIFAPTARMAADVITAIANALKKASPEVKTLAGIITGVLFGALVGATVRTVALTLAKWGLFGALMAVDSAIAVGNPLLWIGIAAAAAAVITVTALVAAKEREAKAFSDTATAAKDMAAGYDQASEAMGRMSKLKELTDAANHLRSQMAALQKDLRVPAVVAPNPNAAGSVEDALLRDATGTSPVQQDNRAAALEKLKEKLTAIESQIAQTMKEKNDEEARAAADAARKAAEDRIAQENRVKDFQQSILEQTARDAADRSTDPFAQIEYERAAKIAEAVKLGAGNDIKLLGQINTLFDARRIQRTKEISDQEQEALAKITQTRVDDLEIEKRKTLEAFTGTEAAKVQIAADFDQQITDTKIEEAAKLTETQVDDLVAARDRELELFSGTEAEKAAIAARYAKQIADTQIEEQQRAFDNALALAKQNKDYGQIANLTGQKAISGTQAGQLGGVGGIIPADPVTMLVEEFVKLASQIENVGKLLNPIDTVLQAMFDILEPLLNGDLQDAVDLLVEIGQILGELLAPFLSEAAIGLQILVGILRITTIPLKLLGELLMWLNNKVIVPVGNVFIDIMNGIIGAINSALGWLGVHIDTLDHLKTISDDYMDKQQELNDRMDQVNQEIADLKDTFDKKRKELEDAYDKNIGALQDLLHVGAITLTEYDRMVASYNQQLDTDLSSLDATEKAQLATLKDILDQLQKGIMVIANQDQSQGDKNPFTNGFLNTYALGIKKAAGFATGAVDIPGTQSAIVHKGEMVVPESFAEGLRSGKISLGSKQSAGEVTMISLTVNGSVLTPDDLLTAISKGIAKKGRRGTLPAEAMN